MSKGEIIDLVVLRIQSDLDIFQRTKTIPHTILEGTYDIEEIKNVYYDDLSAKHKKIADRLYKEYYERIEENVDSLKLAMKKDYARVVKNLANTCEITNYSDPLIVMELIEEFIIKFEDIDYLKFNKIFLVKYKIVD